MLKLKPRTYTHLFVLPGRWMIPRNQLYVVHYTLGPFKPWIWWSLWLVRVDSLWHSVRGRLPPDARGATRGQTSRQALAEAALSTLPLLVVLLNAHRNR